MHLKAVSKISPVTLLQLCRKMWHSTMKVCIYFNQNERAYHWNIPRCFLLNVYDAADYSARTKMAFINIAFSHYAAHVSLKMYQNDMSLMSYFFRKIMSSVCSLICVVHHKMSCLEKQCFLCVHQYVFFTNT